MIGTIPKAKVVKDINSKFGFRLRLKLKQKIMSTWKSYFFHRATVAAFYFLVVLVSANFLEKKYYSTILNIIFLSKFLQILNFGSVSGFFVDLYSKKKSILVGNEDRIYFSQSLLFHYMVLGIIFIAISPFLENYILPFVSFLFLSPFYSLEPYFRSKKIFSFSLIPDLVLSGALICTVFFSFLKFDYEYPVVYLCFIFIISLSFIIITLRKSEYIRRDFKINYIMLWDIIKIGAPVFISTALFMIMTGADRLFIPFHRDDEFQAVYFLSLQLITGFMIMPASINFINTVDIGESINNSPDTAINFLKNKLWKSTLITSLCYFFLLVFSFFVENYYLENYEGLLFIVFFVGLGFSLFYISGAITPALGYIGFQKPVTYSMFLVTILSITFNFIVLNMDVSKYYLAIATGILLSLHSLFSIIYTIAKLRFYKSK
jgi:O-antigen/teichoic acid export membrane protein